MRALLNGLLAGAAGTVALNAARRFPRRIASLTLIEPVAFHLLGRADEPDGWREIAALAERHVAFQAYLSDYVWRQTLAGCKGCHTNS